MAAALDVEDVHLLAYGISLPDLYRGVPAAVQHERRIPAKQPRRVDAQLKVRPAARGLHKKG